MTLNLGTKDQPIHIDFSSNELRRSQPAEFSVASSSLSLPQRPLATHVPLNPQAKSLNTSWGKVKPVLSPFVTPSLITEPMITHSQDVVQPLKRKRVDAEEDPDPDPELAKRLKKSEKKRRKRDRRAARVAQLGNNISSLHSPSPPFHVDFATGPSHRSPDALSRGSLLRSVSMDITMPRLRYPTSEPHISMSPRGSHDKNKTRQGAEALELTGQRLISSHNSYIALSTPVHSVPVHSPPQTSIDDDNPINQVANTTNTTTLPSATTSSSLLNRRIKERMALLIEHQRLATGAGSLPPAPLHRTTNYTAPKPVVDDTVSAKQNSLDRAISENKAALAQLSEPLGKEEKLILMKAVTERNKLITQLTNEIKKHLDSLRSSIIAAPTPPPPDSPVMRFKWPETEFPLYLIISNDDDSNSAS